jgi:alpha-beta hydrolase superfamily lysophospholipase
LDEATGQTPGVNIDWRPDILGDGFEAATLALRPGPEGDLVATLVRHRATPAPSRRAALYVHGYNDYFFQRDLASWFTSRGIDFYALDLRRYGRSLRPGQTPNHTRDLGEYDEDLDAAVEVILDEGHERLVMAAHSTGGLTVPLWAARRRGLPFDGFILNSPFFEFKQPAVVRAAVGRAASLVARWQPMRALPAGGDSLYGDSIHASRNGEWDYNLDWKPSPGFAVRLSWLTAIIDGHRVLHGGLGLEAPALVMSSTRTVTVKAWDDDLRRGDAVLDADSIARWAPALGRHVTVVRITDGLHDLVLSSRPARDSAYDTMGTWLGAWVG